MATDSRRARGRDAADVPDARGMREQLLHGDVGHRPGQGRVQRRQRGIQPELACLDRLQHRDRGELLADGCQAERRVGPHRHRVLHIGQSVGLAQQHLIAARHQHAAAGLPTFEELACLLGQVRSHMQGP
jgi:hypothetical protein